MPQLFIETYFSQYFWLVVILALFYYFTAQSVVPSVASALKVRAVIESSSSSEGVEGAESVSCPIKSSEFSVSKFL
jgi:capsule polysaccharide export protein KpsE/RkpR